MADAYEAYVGRWSRLVAPLFVRWLGLPAGRRWLDVGAGTGALSAAVTAAGGDVYGVDPSRGFVAGRADVVVGDARALPFRVDGFDAVVSGLALNFVPDAGRAVAEFTRVAVPGATVAAYVWDYAEGMAMMRLFWDAALEVDPSAPDEGPRFSLCRPEALADLWQRGRADGRPGRADRDRHGLPGLRRLLDPVPRRPGRGARVPDVPARTNPARGAGVVAGAAAGAGHPPHRPHLGRPRHDRLNAYRSRTA